MKSKLLLGIGIVSILSSCKKDLNSISFDLNYESSFTIPSAIGINTPFNSPTPDITTNSTQEFNNHDVPSDKVKEVVLKELILSIKSPQGKKFDFLKSIHLYLKSPNNTETEIGYIDNIQDGQFLIRLNTTKQNLIQHIKSDKFSLRANVTTDQTNFEDTEIKTQLTFGVTSEVF